MQTVRSLLKPAGLWQSVSRGGLAQHLQKHAEKQNHAKPCRETKPTNVLQEEEF